MNRSTVLAVLALSAPHALTAQAITGIVSDHPSSARLAGVRVELVDVHGRTVVHTASDSAGTFELRAPRAGTYRVNASLVGYQPFASDAIEIRSGELVQLSLQISIQAIPLEPVIVRIRSDRGSRLAEFEKRRSLHEAGFFITRDDIARRPVASTSELLVGLQRVTVSNGDILFPRGIHSCVAHVFINGAEVGAGSRFKVDDRLLPDWIGGIEVYPTAALAPLDYRRADGCGVVLFWTRDAERGCRWRWWKLFAATGFVAIAATLTR